MVVTGVALVALLAVSAHLCSGRLVHPGRSLLDTLNSYVPPCECDTNTTHSPYRLSSWGNITTYKGQDWFCFSVLLDTADTVCAGSAASKEPCCNMDLYKLELIVRPACRFATNRALLFKGYDMTIGGVQITEQINYISVDVNETAQIGTIKVVKGLDLPKSVVAAFNGKLPVCINLLKKPDGSRVCNPFTNDDSGLFIGSPAFGTSAYYSLFNSNKAKDKCCPTGVTPIFPPAPGVRSPPPPTPLPAPPPSFPYCDCKSFSPKDYPWRVQASKTSLRGGTERICYQLAVDSAAASACNTTVGCCRTGLQKIEVEASGKCRGDISPFTLTGTTGTKSSFLWDRERDVLKFTKLDLTYAQGVSGASLCFTLKGGDCSTYADLCPAGSCPVALFNPPGNNCCPVFTVSG